MIVFLGEVRKILFSNSRVQVQKTKNCLSDGVIDLLINTHTKKSMLIGHDQAVFLFDVGLVIHVIPKCRCPAVNVYGNVVCWYALAL